MRNVAFNYYSVWFIKFRNYKNQNVLMDLYGCILKRWKAELNKIICYCIPGWGCNNQCKYLSARYAYECDILFTNEHNNKV